MVKPKLRIPVEMSDTLEPWHYQVKVPWMPHALVAGPFISSDRMLEVMSDVEAFLKDGGTLILGSEAYKQFQAGE